MKCTVCFKGMGGWFSSTETACAGCSCLLCRKCGRRHTHGGSLNLCPGCANKHRAGGHTASTNAAAADRSSGQGGAAAADPTLPARFHKIPGAAGVALQPSASSHLNSGNTHHSGYTYQQVESSARAPSSTEAPLPDRFYRIPGAAGVDPSQRAPAAATAPHVEAQQPPRRQPPPVDVGGAAFPDRFYRIPGAKQPDPAPAPSPRPQHQPAAPTVDVDGAPLPDRFHRIPGAADVDPLRSTPTAPHRAVQPPPADELLDGVAEVPARFYLIPGARVPDTAAEEGAAANEAAESEQTSVDISTQSPAPGQPPPATDPASADTLDDRLRALRGRAPAATMTTDQMASKFEELFGKSLVSQPRGRTTTTGAVAAPTDDPDELIRQALDEVALERAAENSKQDDLDGMAFRLRGLRGRDGSGGGASGGDGGGAGAQIDNGDPSVPPSFRCPISHEVMADPVTTADGHSYERGSIERWLREHSTSPKTGQVLPHKELTPAHALRNAIEEWGSIAVAAGARDADAPSEATAVDRPAPGGRGTAAAAAAAPDEDLDSTKLPSTAGDHNLRDGGAASLDAGGTFGDLISEAADEVSRIADSEARNLLADGGADVVDPNTAGGGAPTTVDQSEVAALLASAASELLNEGSGQTPSPNDDSNGDNATAAAKADAAAVEWIVQQAAEEAALQSTVHGVGREQGPPTDSTSEALSPPAAAAAAAEQEVSKTSKPRGPPAPPSASLAFWDDPTSALPKPPPADRLPWCCVCNEDACFECEKCERDLFCKRCFIETHDELGERHTAKAYKAPAEDMD